MTIEIDRFRMLNLYKQAIRFTHQVLDWTNENLDEIGLKECVRIRKMAMKIPSSIATATAEINVRNKYKKLNRGKDALQNVMPVLRDYGMEENELSVELLKLFNGYFGLLNRKKNASRG
ncbi:hypothetical protein CV093_04450 [Oceanobacillus sp. 143]|uniref:Four helix bundle protein n=1 Tax=Oceanobacillus zhaokaii TaxID=2052660 RepID=A0A345PDZ6_9BACI|nr:hypothetical protein [Oceanobacillus zhaokaii]AXI08226.1 hypothetical protein CUC15_04270 [Oceanobacillus zhaokaii]QGS68153.1 hypothetical protein CV093_04450 [Oceanobacillus sp. 143]